MPGDAALLDVITPAALAAGRAYARQGRVRHLALSADGGRIEAEVRGTAPKPYRQTISLHRAASAASPPGPDTATFHGSCTCPVGRNCKHVAAVLLAARHSLPRDPPKDLPAAAGRPMPMPDPRPALPFEVSAWLATLDDTKDAELEAYPDTIRQRLLYVLENQPGIRFGTVPQVTCWTVTLRRDDSFPTPRSYAPRQVELPARYLRPSDRLILRRLARFGYGPPTLDRDDDPAELLRRIVATGRAHWADPTGPALAEAATRPGKLGWAPNPDGTQHATLLLDAGLLGFQLPAPWYVDPATGEIGPVDPGMPLQLATKLLAAPPIAPEAVPDVASELARRLPSLAIPAPAKLSPPEPLRGPVVAHLRLTIATLPFDPALRGTRRYPFSGKSYQVPLAQLAFGYGPILLPSGREEPPAVITHGERLYRLERDGRGEQAVLRRMTGIGFAKVNQVAPVPIAFRHGEDFVLDDDSDGTDWLHVLTREVPALRASGWQVEVAEDFPIRLVEPDAPMVAELTQASELAAPEGDGDGEAPRLAQDPLPEEGLQYAEGSGIDWLELHLGVMVGGQRIDLVPILVSLIANGVGAALTAADDGDEDAPFLVPLPDGRLLALPRARIRPILLALTEIFAGGGIAAGTSRVRFAPHDAAELALIEEESGLPWLGGEALRNLGRKLREAGDAIPEVTLPEGFHGAL
ncbi:MAG: Non-specific serine/threonine protein kinase, partial [Belnapia sp.]|nr:Non-specific serine/threonine protein kinase [Belnapia sp.]